MVRYNFISEEEAAAAKKEPLRINPNWSNRHGKVGWSFQILVDELNKEFLDEDALKRGGLTITTTLDSRLQSTAEDLLEKQLTSIEQRRFAQSKERTPIGQNPLSPRPTRLQWLEKKEATPSYLQAAAVFLDSQTGAVRTLIGGRNLRESQYNRAKWSRSLHRFTRQTLRKPRRI